MANQDIEFNKSTPNVIDEGVPAQTPTGVTQPAPMPSRNGSRMDLVATAEARAAARAAIVEQRAKGWVDFHPETYCHRCGRLNIESWFAESDLWNRAEGDGGGGILCPICFVDDYEEVTGQKLVWRLAPADTTDEASYVRVKLNEVREVLADVATERDRYRDWNNDARRQLAARDGELAGLRAQLAQAGTDRDQARAELEELRTLLLDALQIDPESEPSPPVMWMVGKLTGNRDRLSAELKQLSAELKQLSAELEQLRAMKPLSHREMQDAIHATLADADADRRAKERVKELEQSVAARGSLLEQAVADRAQLATQLQLLRAEHASCAEGRTNVSGQAEREQAGAQFDQWCIVELLGHRRLAGRIRETTLAGAGMLRLDIPPTDGHPAQTQYVSPGSVYALHPTTEEIARAVAAGCRPEPVHRWELPAAPVVEPGDSFDESGDEPAEPF